MDYKGLYGTRSWTHGQACLLPRAECTTPSHSQSLVNFVANTHPQGISAARSESVSTGVWCVPGVWRKTAEIIRILGKGRFYFLRRTLVCTTKPNPGSKEVCENQSHLQYPMHSLANSFAALHSQCYFDSPGPLCLHKWSQKNLQESFVAQIGDRKST